MVLLVLLPQRSQGCSRTFPLTLPRTLLLLLPFPIHVVTGVPAASLTGSAVPSAGTAVEPSGTSPGHPRPLLADTPRSPHWT